MSIMIVNMTVTFLSFDFNIEICPPLKKI